jgi:hypothetical protein
MSFFRRKTLAVLSSLFFWPVSCVLASIPAAHLFSHASTRAFADGRSPHAGTVGIPLVEKAAPAAAVVFDAAKVPEALARWPGLTPRLPPTGGTAFGDYGRLQWDVLDDAGGAQTIEARYLHRWADTRIVRYRATDDGVTLLTSRLFTRTHASAGLGVGIVFATLVTFGASRLRRRLPAEPPPPRRHRAT